MTGRLLRRCLALAVVGLWLAPSAGALALGLHVTLEHHGHPDHDAPMLGDLVAAAAHGHHHGAAAPDHEHPAHLDAAPGLAPSPAATAAEPPGAAADDVRGEPVVSRHRRAPPVPLFHAHCSLLL